MVAAKTGGTAGLAHELARICGAVEIESPVAFTFAGSRFETPLQGPSSSGATQPQTPPALAQLQGLLYEHCYTRRFDGRSVASAAAPLPPAPAPDPGFIQRLVDANAGGERLDHGWQVTKVEAAGQVTAAKDGVYRVFAPGRYFPSGVFGGSVQPGTTVAVWLAKGSLSLQPGFYYVYGEVLGEAWSPQSLLRLYWNVRSDGAARLLAALTRRLNRFQVPFQLKTLTQPEHYARRSDGTVLYLARRYFAIVAELYSELAPVLASDLEADTPLFTKALAPGLGLAEDPGNGDSFGLSRCRILAAGLWQAHVSGARAPAARVAEVEACFSRHGLTLERPYLNPRSADRYELPAMEGGP